MTEQEKKDKNLESVSKFVKEFHKEIYLRSKIKNIDPNFKFVERTFELPDPWRERRLLEQKNKEDNL